MTDPIEEEVDLQTPLEHTPTPNKKNPEFFEEDEAYGPFEIPSPKPSSPTSDSS